MACNGTACSSWTSEKTVTVSLVISVRFDDTVHTGGSGEEQAEMVEDGWELENGSYIQ